MAGAAYSNPLMVPGAYPGTSTTSELERQDFAALLSSDPTPGELELPESRIGKVVGSYRLLEVLGRGGMGSVYRAEHVKLGRDVALKLLREDYAHRRDAVTRFFQEARAVNLIRHRNIVDVYDYVELEGGTVFIIMELLDGCSLGRLMRGPLALGRAIGILAQICEGLAAAHAVGIVHRDLKPDNIIIVRSPEGSDLVKILDFGVAKLADRYSSSKDLTAAGAVIGTPAYMSPEQAGGLAVDATSDVYSLGAIMYELFVHEPLFRAGNFGDFVRRHLNDEPVRPSRVLGCEDFDPDLEAIILRCVAKRADLRYQSALELRADLLGLLAGLANKVGDDAGRTGSASPGWTVSPPSAVRGSNGLPRFSPGEAATGRPPSADALAVDVAGERRPGPTGVGEHAGRTRVPAEPARADRSQRGNPQERATTAFGTPRPFRPPGASVLASDQSPARPRPRRQGVALAIALVLVAASTPFLIPPLAHVVGEGSRAGDRQAPATVLAPHPASTPAPRDLGTLTPLAPPAQEAPVSTVSHTDPASPPGSVLPDGPDGTGQLGSANGGAEERPAGPQDGATEAKPVRIRVWSTPTAELHAAGRPGALCQTPCALTIDPGDRGFPLRRVYVIEKAGYKSEEITVDLGSPPKQVRVDLEKLRGPARDEPADARAPF